MFNVVSSGAASYPDLPFVRCSARTTDHVSLPRSFPITSELCSSHETRQRRTVPSPDGYTCDGLNYLCFHQQQPPGAAFSTNKNRLTSKRLVCIRQIRWWVVISIKQHSLCPGLRTRFLPGAIIGSRFFVTLLEENPERRLPAERSQTK